MFKTVVVIIILFQFIFSLAQSNNSHYINLIKDFVLNYEVSTKIIAYLCWSKETQLSFGKLLMKQGFFTTLAKFDDPINYLRSPEQHLFILDLNCVGAEEVLSKAERTNLFRQPFRWVLWGDIGKQLLKKYYLQLDSQIYVVEKTASHYDIKLYYKISNDSEIHIDDMCRWDIWQGLFIFNKEPSAKRRSDLMGMSLRAVHVNTDADTPNHLEDYKNKHIDSNTKLNWIIAKHLMSLLNATAVNKFVATWGYKNKTTNMFSGMIGELQTLNADYGGSPSFISEDRMKFVDYIPFVTPTKIKFIFRAPPLSYVTNIFTLPFDTLVWYSCFILVSIFFFVLYTIVYWEWNDIVFKEKFPAALHPLRPNAGDVVVMELGAIAQQGAESELLSISGRIATIFTFLTLMFLHTFYSANIIALLQSTTDSIDTLHDLLHSRMALGVEDIVYGHYYFENANDTLRKRIYQQKIAPKGKKSNFFSLDEGMRKMQNEFFAFHVELTAGYKIIADIFQESEKCKLREIEYMDTGYPYMIVQKNSPYKEIIRVGLQKIHDSGLHAREFKRVYTEKPQCIGMKGSHFGSVGLVDCYGAFLIFGIGLAISIIILLVENIQKRYLLDTFLKRRQRQ